MGPGVSGARVRGPHPIDLAVVIESVIARDHEFDEKGDNIQIPSKALSRIFNGYGFAGGRYVYFDFARRCFIHS